MGTPDPAVIFRHGVCRRRRSQIRSLLHASDRFRPIIQPLRIHDFDKREVYHRRRQWQRVGGGAGRGDDGKDRPCCIDARAAALDGKHDHVTPSRRRGENRVHDTERGNGGVGGPPRRAVHPVGLEVYRRDGAIRDARQGAVDADGGGEPHRLARLSFCVVDVVRRHFLRPLELAHKCLVAERRGHCEHEKQQFQNGFHFATFSSLGSM